jgi:hypothetical protein
MKTKYFYNHWMLQRWFREGIDDRDIFRRRCRSALAIQWLLQLSTIVLILLTR